MFYHKLKIYRKKSVESSSFNVERNDVIRTGDIVKQDKFLWKQRHIKETKIAGSFLLSLFMCSNVMMPSCPLFPKIDSE